MRKEGGAPAVSRMNGRADRFSTGAELAELARDLIREAFEQSNEEYEDEIRRASSLTGIRFAALRPVFVNGSPDDLVAGRYLLFLGLNPKLDVKRPSNVQHYASLNGGAESNEQYTLGYFRNIPALHRYFKKRAVVVRAYARALGASDDGDDRVLLRRWCLFHEFVPYHSEATDRSLAPIEALPNVQRARRLFEALLTRYPPACIVLDGNETHGTLGPAHESEQSRILSASTRAGACRIRLGWYRGVPVAKCSFIGSIRGVNSRAQREEFGRLIAEHCAPRHPGFAG